MAIDAADKIFIDADDEINFVVEKITNSAKNRIILVMPQHALVASSTVSMNILAQQIWKSKKLLIVVSEDKFAQSVATRIGITAVDKVSSITPTVWEGAQISKEKAVLGLKMRKEELLSVRKPAVEESVDSGVQSMEDQGESEEQNTGEQLAGSGVQSTEEQVVRSEEGLEQNDESLNEDEVMGTIAQEEASSVDTLPTALQAPDVTSVNETPEIKPVEEEEVDIRSISPIQRVRRSPKLVKLGGIEIYAGGDVLELEQQNRAIIAANQDMNDSDVDSKPARPIGGFTGKDWTKHTTKQKSSGITGGGFASLWNRRTSTRRPGEMFNLEDKDTKKPLWKNKWLWIGSAVLIGMLVVAVYVFSFVLNTVQIKVNLKTAEIPIEERITADINAVTVNIETLTIPAKLQSDTGTASETGTATGTSTRGNKSAGLIEIWNKTTQPINVKKGAIIINPSTNLKYLLTEDTAVPAGTTAGAIITPGGQNKEVRMEAEKFGAEYNIAADDTVTDLQLQGYPTSDVIVKRFRPIEGGTTEQFTSVAQKDVDAIKPKLEERIKKLAKDKIINILQEEYYLLDGTDELNVKELKITPAIGEEASQFTISIVGELSIVVVLKDDLNTAVTELASRTQENDIKFVLSNTGNQQVTNIEKIPTGVKFTISSSTSLQTQIDENKIKQDIAGKRLSEARNYLDMNVPEIESNFVSFAPEFIPEWLRFVPQDFGRIKIDVIE